jgi:hypothetical protein
MRIDPGSPLPWRIALLLLCGVLLAPLLLTDVPPLLDYPNHLARMVLLAWPHDPTLSRLAVPHWGIIPDLAIDLVMPPLLHILPVYLAGRLVLGGIILLPVLGSVAYSRAACGERSWWALGVGLVGYNEAVLLGFVNFIAAVGVALFVAAAWLHWRETHPWRAGMLAATGALAVFFCHLMGLPLLALLLVSYEVTQVSRRSGWHNAAARLLLLSAIFLPVVVLYALSPLSDQGGPVAFGSLWYKAWQAFAPVVNYRFGLDLVTACGIVAFLLACALSGRLRVAPAARLALPVLALLFVICPGNAKGAQNIDLRFSIMLALLLFAAVQPRALPRRVCQAATTAAIMLFALRMTVLAAAWHGSAADIADLRRVIADVPPDSTVLAASVAPSEAPRYWQNAPTWRRLSNGTRIDPHMAALLLIEHHAFWPFLFDNPSQQPIAQQPRYRSLATQTGSMPDVGAFARASGVNLCGFDFVLLLDAGGAADPAGIAGGRLIFLKGEDFAALYRVARQPRRCGGT